MDITTRHQRFLYPVVRVRAGNAAGSGTIIYCEEDPKKKGEFITLTLTNHHVIDGLVKHKKEWDSVMKREIEKEFLEKARVDVFDYVNESTVDSTQTYYADIIAYDKNHDLAILRINSPRQFTYIAPLIPEDKIGDLRLFMDIVVSGCSLAHEPFCNYGQITFLNEIIDQKKYTMYNAASFFGNSGGALFLRETGELIGVPSRITAQQLGFGVDIVSWMGFGAAPERLFEFAREQELQFLWDNEDNFHAAMKRRTRKKEQALLALKAEMLSQGTDKSDDEADYGGIW